MYLSAVNLSRYGLGLCQHEKTKSKNTDQPKAKVVEPQASVKRGPAPIIVQTEKPAKNIFERLARKIEDAVIRFCGTSGALIGATLGFTATAPVAIPIGVGAAAATRRGEAVLIALCGGVLGFVVGEYVGKKAGILPGKLFALPFNVMSSVAEATKKSHL